MSQFDEVDYIPCTSTLRPRDACWGKKKGHLEQFKKIVRASDETSECSREQLSLQGSR